MKKLTLLATITLFVNLYGYSQAKSDTAAIKEVVERESATYRNGDFKGHADCWKIQPYSRILISTADGKFLDIPPQMMVMVPANNAAVGGTSSNSNYKIGIVGNSAWASFNEESIAKDGQKSYTIEIKILEKINGDWKIVALSVHGYNK
jgi:hypothetical protein